MKRLNIFFLLLFINGCTLSPGMHMTENSNQNIYIESLDKSIKIEKLEDNLKNQLNSTSYRIGNGDQIAVTIWGLPDIFPIRNVPTDQNLRRVDSKGEIYFPYVGLIKASSKTQNELRDDLTSQLSNYFNDPQVDVSIARFNSQKVYLLGEVNKPTKINLTDIPLSLSDALGEVFGLNNNSSDGGAVFVIRQGKDGESPRIFRANLSSPSGFLNSSKFFLQDNDIVYVNAKSTARWNRVISQFFPFSTFLTSVDRLTSN